MVTKHYVVAYAFLSFLALLGGIVPMAISGRIYPSVVIVVLLVAALLPALLIWLLRKMGYPIGRPVICPRCAIEMPLFRKPRSLNEALWGGYRCANCGTDMDARGRELEAGTPR